MISQFPDNTGTSSNIIRQSEDNISKIFHPRNKQKDLKQLQRLKANKFSDNREFVQKKFLSSRREKVFLVFLNLFFQKF